MTSWVKDGMVAGVTARIAAVGVLLAAWTFVGLFASESLPTPWDVLESLVNLLTTGEAWPHVILTFRRVVIATLISAVLGIVLGAAMGLSRAAESFFLPPVVVALGIPGPVYIIMAILILGIGETSTLIALIISVIPFVSSQTFEGVRNRDMRLDQMANVYRYSRVDYLHHVLIAQMTPTLFSALRTSFALSWKLVVLMEALSASSGIGARMVFYFRLLEPDVVVAYLAIFMVIMVLVERLLFSPVQERISKWSRASTTIEDDLRTAAA